jgi:hypothetical protein
MMKTLVVSLFVAAALLMLGGSAVYGAHSDRGCNNCHVPHKASVDDVGVPLWSTAQTADGLPTFTLYTSHTFANLGVTITQPDGASKLCLGCHDGSYSYFLPGGHGGPSSPVIFQPGDLAKSHPISFIYDTSLANKVPNGGLRDPATALSNLGGTIAADLLDANSKMQCTSCHDIHVTGKGTNMLRYDWDPVAKNDHIMCRVCHNK